jgi:hypothetical protein
LIKQNQEKNMPIKLLTVFIFAMLLFSSCAKTATESANGAEGSEASGGKTQSASNQMNSNAGENTSENFDANKTRTAQTKEPRTVRDFFNLLPQKYFALEGCAPDVDKNCEKARKEYIDAFLEVEDAKNGYWKSGCDGAQSCLTLALFKRPDASYIVHILTEFEMGEDSYFLEYKDGKWSDIGARIIPEYSTKNTYVPPQKGTTVEVFKKNFPEPEYSERGAKIYDLQWKDGKFSIKK